LSSGCKAVRVKETFDDGVVISALEIIEPGFFELSVAIEAKKRSIKLSKKNLQLGDKT